MAANDQDVEIDFSHFVTILWRRRWIVLLVAAVAIAAATSYAFLATPVYRAATLLNIEQPTKSINSDVTTSRDQGEDYLDTQFKLITSDTILERVYNDLNLASVPEFSSGIKHLLAAITVIPVSHTHLCYVNADSLTPALAQKISVTLSQYYVEQNLNNQLFMSKDVLEALQLRNAGANSRTINESLPTVVNNRLIQTIKEQIFTAEAQLADMQMKYTAAHPAVVALRSRLKRMQLTEQSEIDNIVQSLKTDLSGQLQGNNVRVVDAARLPDRPVRPRKLIAIIFGVMGGIFLGGFVAVVMEFLDQTVRTQEDVERRIGIPFVGVIPYARHKKNAKAHAPLLSADVSLTSEAFRNLRTMTSFVESLKEERALLITSSVQEEGKSYVASGLAVVQAQLGKRVLLIDGDLRRPRQHRNFGVSSEKGVTDFLAGEASDPKALVQASDVQHLSIMTCGPRPPNPAELLNTDKVELLLKWAREHFDRVIIDCPPVFPISDVLLWGRYVKPALFVMRFGSTRSPLIQAATSRLQGGGLKLLGGVVNGARVATMTYAEGRYYEQYYREYTDTDVATVKSRKS
jgi:capsular exopolysaccharide synthesis family protein